MRVIAIFFLILSNLIFAEVKVKIHEPIRFKTVNTKAYGDLVVGQGAIEVYSTAIEEDIGKKIKIRFPEKGLMTNKKRWLKVEGYRMAKADESFVIEKEKRIVNFYAFLRRREINKSELDGTLVEGEYLGYTPIVIEQYGKPLNPKPVPLPYFPEKETKPAPLPEKLD